MGQWPTQFWGGGYGILDPGLLITPWAKNQKILRSVNSIGTPLQISARGGGFAFPIERLAPECGHLGVLLFQCTVPED